MAIIQKILAKFVFLMLLLLFANCKVNSVYKKVRLTDNLLIINMYLKDIEIRALDEKTDTVNLENYDRIHRNKILEMLANNQIITPMDKYRSALILQHTAAKICDGELTSVSPENYLLAFHLSSTALNELKKQKDSITIKKHYIPRMVALNYDRYLLFSMGYQKFGTQFLFDDKSGEMILAPIDTSLSNDKERKEYNVESLKYLISKYKMKPFSKD